ncbi:MAG: methylated-DNA--[protein]-cysteine S-methyltransferase [Mycobacteriales bacterium]
MQDGYTLFDTAVGVCGLAWRAEPAGRAARIVGLRLPGEDPDRAGREPAERGTHAAPPAPPTVHAVIDRIVALLAGGADDLTDVDVDLDGRPAFDRAVWAVTRAIPPGQTLTYGDVAARVGAPGSARGVGQALGRNPVPVIVPCHRVVAAGGHTGGFSAPGGVATKQRILAIEAAHTPDTLALFGR